MRPIGRKEGGGNAQRGRSLIFTIALFSFLVSTGNNLQLPQ